jgi:hypothetical protein
MGHSAFYHLEKKRNRSKTFLKIFYFSYFETPYGFLARFFDYNSKGDIEKEF